MSTGTDRAAAIVALTATLTAGLHEDEAAARMASSAGGDDGRWSVDPNVTYGKAALVRGRGMTLVHDRTQAVHIARHDPARTLRDVKAGRDLLAAILAEPHDWVVGDPYYSCSQAVDGDPSPGESPGPGSGCTDPDRAGQPCDCGRDARVERLLRILASVYEEGELR